MLSWLRGSTPGKLVGQTGTILAVVKRKSTGPCLKLCLAQKVAAANAGSPPSRVALSYLASAWVFSPIRLAKLANSPSIRRCAASALSERYRRFWKYSRSVSLNTRPLCRQRNPNQPPASPRQTPVVTIKTIIPVPKANITPQNLAESVLNRPVICRFWRVYIAPPPSTV